MIATALSLAKEAEDLTSTSRAHTNKGSQKDECGCG